MYVVMVIYTNKISQVTREHVQFNMFNLTYTEKCLSLLNTDQFMKLNTDPTKTTEGKIQRTIRKIKSKLSSQQYYKLYPTGSCPGKFYGTAKIHKLTNNSTIDELPIRPIVSNIGTATYHLAKHLAKLLSPLSQSEYTVKSTRDFTEKLKVEKVPTGYKMVSFDVKSLFTNVPLERTIEILLKRVYDDNEIYTSITRKEMKDMLILCTKNVHFTFNGEVYVQIDGVAMGSPLGPVLAGIFMVELERKLVPTLVAHVKSWKRYVDDTIAYVKIGSTEYVISVLNSFHEKIQFTYEMENDHKLSFLDVLLIRNGESIETTVFRKSTNNDIYLNWNSFAPNTWKKGTLKTLVQRAYTVCSTDQYLQNELDHLKNVFHMKNGYPKWVINQVLDQVKAEQQENALPNEHIDSQENQGQPVINEIKSHLLVIPYGGSKGEYLIKSMKRELKRLLPTNVDPRIAYTGTKLGFCFHIKDKTKFEHQHDLVYEVGCSNPTCNMTYIGEVGRRITERIKDHNGRDKNSHMVKHSIETGHDAVTSHNFKIIGNGYRNNNKKWKIAEALFIKEYKPPLNVQEKSVPLKLLN